jgi:SAM-dependent methyltransferase
MLAKVAESADAVTDRADHWDSAYRDRGVAGVSWFQSEPALSLELIERLGVAPDAAVMDVGGGASSLVDHLVDRGFTDISVLDISQAALEDARLRVGEIAAVRWLHEDLLSWNPARRYGLWHDRAVFHFLTEEADRDRYLDCLGSGIEPGGGLIIATFAEDGPEYCSGLRVARYSAQDLLNLLGPEFQAVAVRRELHMTPGGVVQPFTWVAARAA